MSAPAWVGVRLRPGEGKEGQTQPCHGPAGPWGWGLDPQRPRAGPGQGCEAAGLELGPRPGEPQPTAAPRAGGGRVAASPLPAGLSGSFTLGSAVGKGLLSAGPEPWEPNRTARGPQDPWHLWQHVFSYHLASAGFPYCSRALEKDRTPYTEVNVLYASKFLS